MDTSGIATTTQIIAGVMSELKNARELATISSNSELKEQLSEAYDGLLHLRERLLDLEDEKRQLKADLVKKAEYEGPVPPFGYFYKNGDQDNPMCPKCYQSKEARESYMNPLHSWNRGMRRTCRSCGHHIYEQEMDLSPRRLPLRMR